MRVVGEFTFTFGPSGKCLGRLLRPLIDGLAVSLGSLKVRPLRAGYSHNSLSDGRARSLSARSAMLTMIVSTPASTRRSTSWEVLP